MPQGCDWFFFGFFFFFWREHTNCLNWVTLLVCPFWIGSAASLMQIKVMGWRSYAMRSVTVGRLFWSYLLFYKTALKLPIDYFLTQSNCALFMVKLCCNVGFSLLLFLVSQSADTTSVKTEALLTRSLPQPVYKFPSWKTHKRACKQCIFRSFITDIF